MDNRNIPLYTVPEELASKRIEDSARLTQGVHPIPKDIPKSMELNIFLFLVSIFRWLSCINRRNFKIPAVCMPNMIISSPLIFSMTTLYDESISPTALAVTPMIVKIMLNPSMKPKDLIINNFLDTSTLLPLKLASVRLATYAGNSGNTQGDRKDNKPAVKAKMIETFFNDILTFQCVLRL